MGKIVIDGKAIYEIDEECIKRREPKEQRKQEETKQKKESTKQPDKKGCR